MGSTIGLPLLSNSFQHSLYTLVHFLIPKSQYLNVVASKIFITPHIVCPRLGVIVRRTIKLNAQSLRGTIEIHDVWPIAMLAAELPAIQLATLEVKPQELFGGC